MNSEGSLRSEFIMLCVGYIPQHYKSGAGKARHSLFIIHHSFFTALVRHAVTEGHQGVAEVNVFHHCVGIFCRDVVVAEIPIAPYARAVQPVERTLNILARNEKKRRVYTVGFAEALHFLLAAHQNIAQRFANLVFVGFKAADQLKAEVAEIKMASHGGAEVARADQNRLIMIVKSENMLDLLFELAYAVAVALLTEAAKAVKILPYLRSGGFHNFC